MNLADILKLAGLTQQEPMSSLSSPGSSCNQQMNSDDMRTLVVKIEQPQLQPEQEMVATEEAEGSYANAPDEKTVGDTHNDFSFKGFGKRKRHTRDALGNYGDNPLEESQLIAEYKNFKETHGRVKQSRDARELAVANQGIADERASRTSLPPENEIHGWKAVRKFKNKKAAAANEGGIKILPPDPNDPMANIWAGGKDAIKKAHKQKKIGYKKGDVDPRLAKAAKKRYTDVGVYHDDR